MTAWKKYFKKILKKEARNVMNLMSGKGFKQQKQRKREG